MIRRLTRVLLLATLGVIAPALAPPAQAEPGDELTIYVLTFGPGDHPFFKFGHNALWIQPRDGAAMVLNWGTFDFDSRALISKFVLGRFMYWLSVGSLEDTLTSYRESNRTIEAQELDLSAAQKAKLFARVMENLRPENRAYLYDYFWDNCSTRVRDQIDAVLDGGLREAGRAPGRLTFREHSLRLTADLLPEYLGVHLGLGSRTDAPVDLWQEAFLPERLRDLLRQTRVSGPDGQPRPLVKSERVLFAARRAPAPTRAPGWTPYFAALGLLGGGMAAALGSLARRRRAARVALGVMTAGAGTIFGLCGFFLVFLWVATNHKAAHANANILLCAPWLLALSVVGVSLARGRLERARTAFRLTAAAAAMSLIGLLAKVLPGVTQDNYVFIALLLPLWIGLAIGLRRAGH